MLTALCIFSLGACTNNNSAEDSENTTSSEESAAVESDEPVDPMTQMGIGPITSKMDIPPTIDHAMAEKGAKLFETKCTACHTADDQRKVGPGLKDVTKRRTPEWIMNMIMNPSEMLQKDPIAKDLLETYIAQMANQSLNEEDTRAILEYLRENDSK